MTAPETDPFAGHPGPALETVGALWLESTLGLATSRSVWGHTQLRALVDGTVADHGVALGPSSGSRASPASG